MLGLAICKDLMHVLLRYSHSPAFCVVAMPDMHIACPSRGKPLLLIVGMHEYTVVYSIWSIIWMLLGDMFNK